MGAPQGTAGQLGCAPLASELPFPFGNLARFSAPLQNEARAGKRKQLRPRVVSPPRWSALLGVEALRDEAPISRAAQAGGGTYAFPYPGTTGRWDPAMSYCGLPFVTEGQARETRLRTDPKQFQSSTP